MHPNVELAVKTISEYVTSGNKPSPPDPLPEEMNLRAGVFVSIKKYSKLRGCIGTIEPTKPTLAEEIIDNAISASTRDGRFAPVNESELDDLVISVDVLTEPEPVSSISRLDAKKYGVIVTSGSKRGLLLPDIEGVNSPEEQIAICRQKGGMRPDESVTLKRFTVMRYR